jgi:alpha-glucosidase (family GH31 glycosyl hydrolase)
MNSIPKCFIGAMLLIPFCPIGASAAGTDGTVNLTDGIVYRDKHVRFTVVTDGLIRLEYAPNGKFIDDKSFVGFNREYPQNSAKVTDDNNTVTITTPKLTLTYRKSKGGFTSDNLTITSGAALKPFTWTPGTEQKENLLGTTRTLDGWDGPDFMKKDEDGTRHAIPQKLENGLLARDGWTLIDDSKNFLLDNDPEIPWVKVRKKVKGAQDWYFLAYGEDYKGALKDFIVLSGNISLPPRYAFGFWWSRWWAYSEHEFRELVDNFHNYQIPLEVLVVDMDWHYTDEEHGGWTGWTWNRRLFPEPKKFLNYLRDQNLKITLNLHPASGVKRFEASYPEIARENGIDPSKGADVPWVSSDRKLINSVFNHILNPMSDDGVSFWWLDWQQSKYDAKIDSLSNTWWLNYTFFNKMKVDQPNVRPMIYHRWGGLGNHRYQIGFSGDNFATWKSLDFLPYFTATASNVCYGFWCHDLGGHYMVQGDSVYNSELYVRSLQFGAYSPMMRVHSNKKAELIKEPWNHDRQTLNNLRAAVQRRYQMAPYIYTMARKSHDTGVSICRPMYYDYPSEDMAYKVKNQYMFGDNMIVAPITAPGVDGFSTIDVWLPEGQWYENATGTMLEGGRTYTRSYTISEIPVFIKAGSIIPFHAEKETTLRHCDAPIEFNVFPGSNGQFTLYEDFGDDNNYDTEYATTLVTSKRQGSQLDVEIAPRQGNYKEMPATRRFSVKVIATQLPTSVKIDGVEAGYTYQPEELAVVVTLPEKSCATARHIQFTFPENSDITDGVIGNMRRFVDTFGGLKNKYARLQVTEDFGPMSIIYEALQYAPERSNALIEQFRTNYARLPEIVKAQPMSEKARTWFLKSLGIYQAPQEPADATSQTTTNVSK